MSRTGIEFDTTLPDIAELDVPALLDNADEWLKSARVEGIHPRSSASMLAMAAESVCLALCNRAGVSARVPSNPGDLAGLLPSSHPMQGEYSSFSEILSASDDWRYPDQQGRLRQPPEAEELKTREARIRTFLENTTAYLGTAHAPSI